MSVAEPNYKKYSKYSSKPHATCAFGSLMMPNANQAMTSEMSRGAAADACDQWQPRHIQKVFAPGGVQLSSQAKKFA